MKRTFLWADTTSIVAPRTSNNSPSRERGVADATPVTIAACSGDGFYGVADGNFAVNDEEP